MACRNRRAESDARLSSAFEGNGTIMKKVALTVAVLALGLAACAKNTTDNNAATDTNVENAAAVDTNAAVANDATANLDAALNDVNAAGNEVANAQDAVNNTATNAQ
jgi:hypothetical protein